RVDAGAVEVHDGSLQFVEELQAVDDAAGEVLVAFTQRDYRLDHCLHRLEGLVGDTRHAAGGGAFAHDGAARLGGVDPDARAVQLHGEPVGDAVQGRLGRPVETQHTTQPLHALGGRAGADAGGAGRDVHAPALALVV